MPSSVKAVSRRMQDRLTAHLLGQKYPREGQVIELRYFVGLTNQEIAEALDVLISTVEHCLRFAKTWIRRHWGDEPPL